MLGDWWWWWRWCWWRCCCCTHYLPDFLAVLLHHDLLFAIVAIYSTVLKLLILLVCNMFLSDGQYIYHSSSVLRLLVGWQEGRPACKNSSKSLGIAVSICGRDTARSMLKPLSRMSTSLEKLEMLGNLIAVRDMSGNLVKVRESVLTGKMCPRMWMYIWIITVPV